MKIPIEILYEDEEYIIFNKPAGLLVIPSPHNEPGTLVHRVNEQLKNSSIKLYPCHRLDRDTSGLILFAKGKFNQERMMEAFKKREIKKKYIAFVQGKMPQRAGEIKGMIYNRHERFKGRHPAGKLAITRYKVIEIKKHFSIVEVEPVTGRTNQIRIQFKEIGHPVVGERKYAFARDFAVKFRRTALHALSLKWRHPVTGREIVVESPLAVDMQGFLKNN